MVTGLACIFIGIIGFSLAQDSAALTDVANIIGYLGLALIVISLLIRITID